VVGVATAVVQAVSCPEPAELHASMGSVPVNAADVDFAVSRRELALRPSGADAGALDYCYSGHQFGRHCIDSRLLHSGVRYLEGGVDRFKRGVDFVLVDDERWCDDETVVAPVDGHTSLASGGRHLADD